MSVNPGSLFANEFTPIYQNVDTLQVDQLLAGPGISLFPSSGLGNVQITNAFPYATFVSSNSQVVSGVSTPTPLTFDISLTQFGGITLLNPPPSAEIQFADAGVYKITRQVQLDTITSGGQTANTWLYINGSNAVPFSATQEVIVVGEAQSVAREDYIIVAALDTLEVALESADGSMTATAIAATGNVPDIPSVSIQIQQIG